MKPDVTRGVLEVHHTIVAQGILKHYIDHCSGFYSRGPEQPSRFS